FNQGFIINASLTFINETVNSNLQFFNVKRFEQVIQRTEFYRFYCILIIRCYKYYFKIGLLKLLQEIKAIHYRHFNIKKNQIGFKLVNCLSCIQTIFAH